MKNGVKRETLHPFASRYSYASKPLEAEGIFKGRQTSPWIQVPRPSDWYRGPWQMDRTQGDRRFRRQPRDMVFESAGTSVSGCSGCGMGQGGDGDEIGENLYNLAIWGAVAFVMVRWIVKEF